MAWSTSSKRITVPNIDAQGRPVGGYTPSPPCACMDQSSTNGVGERMRGSILPPHNSLPSHFASDMLLISLFKKLSDAVPYGMTRGVGYGAELFRCQISKKNMALNASFKALFLVGRYSYCLKCKKVNFATVS